MKDRQVGRSVGGRGTTGTGTGTGTWIEVPRWQYYCKVQSRVTDGKRQFESLNLLRSLNIFSSLASPVSSPQSPVQSVVSSVRRSYPGSKPSTQVRAGAGRVDTTIFVVM